MSNLLSFLCEGGNPEVTAVTCSLPGFTPSVDLFLNGIFLTTITIAMPEIRRYCECYEADRYCEWEGPNEECRHGIPEFADDITIETQNRNWGSKGYQYTVQ